MDWDDLRYFVALARLGSLSAAARALKSDHTTVARRVARLEAALGLKLFDRLPRGYVLTAEGSAFAGRAQPVEAAVLALHRFADGQSPAVAGRVRISAPPAFASQWLSPRLSPLPERFPALVIDLVGETGAANLARHEADLAIRLSLPSGDGLVVRRLGDLAYGLYGARDYVAATAEARRVFLGYDESLEGVPQQQWVGAVADGRPFVFQTNDLATLLSATRAGMGLAALPHALAQAWPELVCVKDAPAARRPLWLVVHPDLRRAPRVRAVMDHLIAITVPLRAGEEAAGQSPDAALPVSE